MNSVYQALLWEGAGFEANVSAPQNMAKRQAQGSQEVELQSDVSSMHTCTIAHPSILSTMNYLPEVGQYFRQREVFNTEGR